MVEPAVTLTATLEEDLAFAFELADVARGVTLAWFGRRLPVELKHDATPVTEVDLAAERAIRSALAARFPRDGVLGEEQGLDEGTSGRRWVIDPVDGTKLFAEGIPLWCTLIALEVEGRPVLGVADTPALGARYHAVAGAGAWRGGQRLRVSEVGRLADAFVTYSGLEEWVAGEREPALVRVAAAARRTRGLSDAWGQLLVAQGSVEAVLEHEACYAWDLAAMEVIVGEAGGRLSTLAGDPPRAGADLVVSNGAVHDELLELVATAS
jgi:histidinol-phosphatase